MLIQRKPYHGNSKNYISSNKAHPEKILNGNECCAVYFGNVHISKILIKSGYRNKYCKELSLTVNVNDPHVTCQVK